MEKSDVKQAISCFVLIFNMNDKQKHFKPSGFKLQFSIKLASFDDNDN